MYTLKEMFDVRTIYLVIYLQKLSYFLIKKILLF